MKTFKKLAIGLICVLVLGVSNALALGGGGGKQEASYFRGDGTTVYTYPSTLNMNIGGDLTVTGSVTAGGVSLTGNMDLDGYNLILDTDGDTAFINDRDAGVADDEIDIKIANAVDFTFSANNFEALAGSVFTGALTGNASTATALAADPADCGANNFATTIAASGALTCAAISDADVPDGITVTSASSVEGTNLGTLTDTNLCVYDLAGTEIDCNVTNAPTSSALAANGGNCSAGNSPLGVDAAGAVESCLMYGLRQKTPQRLF